MLIWLAPQFCGVVTTDRYINSQMIRNRPNAVN
jgi:hypothetical protein